MINRDLTPKQWLESAKRFCPDATLEQSYTYVTAPHHAAAPVSITPFLKHEDKGLTILEGCCSINI